MTCVDLRMEALIAEQLFKALSVLEDPASDLSFRFQPEGSKTKLRGVGAADLFKVQNVAVNSAIVSPKKAKEEPKKKQNKKQKTNRRKERNLKLSIVVSGKSQRRTRFQILINKR